MFICLSIHLSVFISLEQGEVYGVGDWVNSDSTQDRESRRGHKFGGRLQLIFDEVMKVHMIYPGWALESHYFSLSRCKEKDQS